MEQLCEPHTKLRYLPADLGKELAMENICQSMVALMVLMALFVFLLSLGREAHV